MIRIFEPRVRVDGRGLLQIGNQLLATKKRPSALELASIQAVANDPCTMREELADRRFRDLRMHTGHILADWIVQAKLSECDATRNRWRAVSFSLLTISA